MWEYWGKMPEKIKRKDFFESTIAAESSGKVSGRDSRGCLGIIGASERTLNRR